MLAAVIGTLGVAIGGALFALGMADESLGGHIAAAVGALLIVGSLIGLGRGRSPAEPGHAG